MSDDELRYWLGFLVALLVGVLVFLLAITIFFLALGAWG